MSDGAGIALYEEASQRKQGLVRLDPETDAEGHFSRMCTLPIVPQVTYI